MAARGRLELMAGGVSAIPFEDGQFDRVLTVQTIHCWPDAAAGLAKVRASSRRAAGS